MTAREIYARDLGWLAQCDQDVALSAMVGGSPVVRLLTYADERDLFAQLDADLREDRGAVE